jgi:hypothetical protein
MTVKLFSVSTTTGFSISNQPGLRQTSVHPMTLVVLLLSGFHAVQLSGLVTLVWWGESSNNSNVIHVILLSPLNVIRNIVNFSQQNQRI